MKTKFALILASLLGVASASAQTVLHDFSATTGLNAGGSWKGSFTTGTDGATAFVKVGSPAADAGQADVRFAASPDFTRLKRVMLRYRVESGNNVSSVAFVVTDRNLASKATKLPLNTSGSGWQTTTAEIDLAGLDSTGGFKDWSLAGVSATGTPASALRISLDSVVLQPVDLPAASDFNQDGIADLIWRNTATGDRGAWLMNGSAYTWSYLGRVSAEWHTAGSGDIDGDGQNDIIWENTATGDRGIWLMNGTTNTGWVYLRRVPVEWLIVGVADFDGNGSLDLVWENTISGDRGLWLMDGTTYTNWVYLGRVPLDWHIVGAADFTGDENPDIVWENTTSGDRGIWLMNGTAYSSWVYLDRVPVEWRIRAVADFSGDGKADLAWENTLTGDRGLWRMDGTVYVGWTYLGRVPLEWRMGY